MKDRVPDIRTSAEFRVPSLLDCLADYLEREGLNKIIPEHFHRDLDISKVWLISLWIVPALFIVWGRGWSAWRAALVLPAAVVVASLLLFAIIIAVRDFRAKSGKGPSVEQIGALLLGALPLVLALTTAWYIRSILAFFSVLLMIGAAFLLAALMHSYSHRITTWIGTVRLAFRMFSRSTSLLIPLLPVLFIFVLFPVFSQEMWQVLAELDTSRAPGAMFLLAVPAFFLVVGSLRRETRSIIGSFPSIDVIVGAIPQIPVIQSKLQARMVSVEEVEEAQRQVAWRDRGKFEEEMLPLFRKRVTLILILLLTITSIILFVVFWFFFSLLFISLLKPTLIQTWTGQTSVNAQSVTVSFVGIQYTFQATTIVVWKVAALLATILSVVAIIYSLTDANVQSRYKEWLTREVVFWIAASCAYSGLAAPDYQIWNYVVKSKKRGLVNTRVVIPNGLSREAVETICARIRKAYDRYPLVVLRLYEKDPNRDYGLGTRAGFWDFIDNRGNGSHSLEYINASKESLRYQHELGLEATSNGSPIPAGWFGDSPRAQNIVRSLWDESTTRGLLLHPYGWFLDKNFHMTIRLAKGLESSRDYYRFMQYVVRLIIRSTPESDLITIEVYYRDTVESLISFTWNRELNGSLILRRVHKC